MSAPVDVALLRERLREYDPAIVKCKGQVEEVREDVLLYHPCCRPEGHEGECRNARRVLGFPGYDTLLSLLDEVEQLRAEAEKERAWKCRCTESLLKGYETGKAEERALVVAWLRRPTDLADEVLTLRWARDIERGVHRRKEEP